MALASHSFPGVPEYGIPPCEPLQVPALSVKQNAGPISVTASFSNVTVRGPASMKVSEVEVNSKKHEVLAKLFIPEFRMSGKYKLSGQLLMLPIEGDGTFTGKYNDIDAIVDITTGRLHREVGPDAILCKSLDVKFHIGSASMKLENLFGGDDELGTAMNSFLNENWETLAEEMQGPIEDALRDFLKPLADHAFGTLRADDIYADSN